MNFKIGLVLMMFCAAPFLFGQEQTKCQNAQKSLYEKTIDLEKGTEDWAKKIAAIVFDDSISEDEKISEFNILKQENNLLVNSEIPMMTDKGDKVESFKKCKSQSKTCRSEKCVANTLIEILGKGDRNVMIKYERKLLSVQINYTYLDCK